MKYDPAVIAMREDRQKRHLDDNSSNNSSSDEDCKEEKTEENPSPAKQQQMVPFVQSTAPQFNYMDRSWKRSKITEDINKTRLSGEDIRSAVEQEAMRFYNQFGTGGQKPPKIEVLSDTNEENIVFAGGQGFVAAAMMAFAHHLPLSLSPDHLWTIISQGFAHHVNEHAEELRYQFVNHTGQIELRIYVHEFRMGQTTPGQWEERVFPQFVREIKKNLNNTKVYELLVETIFSTSTPTTSAASQITLMAAMRAYFRYTMITLCGIPRITLEGKREDWQQLYDQTEQLQQFMLPNPQGQLWIKDIVLPILHEFLESFDGNVNYCFWQVRSNDDS